MLNLVRQSLFSAAVCAVLALSGGAAFAAAGAPPSGPIKAPETGAELKHACGQTIDGFSGREGERMLREMLIVQCWAVVAAVVEMVEAGQYQIGDKPAWGCIENPTDQEALTKAFVTWVGRRPPLLRKPASVAFVEAIEMSERCK